MVLLRTLTIESTGGIAGTRATALDAILKAASEASSGGVDMQGSLMQTNPGRRNSCFDILFWDEGHGFVARHIDMAPLASVVGFVRTFRHTSGPLPLADFKSLAVTTLVYLPLTHMLRPRGIKRRLTRCWPNWRDPSQQRSRVC